MPATELAKCKHVSDTKIHYCMQQWGKLTTTERQRSGTTLTNMLVHYIIELWSLQIVPFSEV